jgi:CarD family transcriptional regulator
MTEKKSTQAAPQKAAAKAAPKSSAVQAQVKTAQMKPPSPKSAKSGKPAPLTSTTRSDASPPVKPPKPEPKTVQELTTAPKPKPETKPAAKAKVAVKLEPKEAVKVAKPAAKIAVADDLPAPVTKAASAPIEPKTPPQPAAPAPQSHSGVISGPMRPMTPPRAMAKAEIFVDGDFVVYPTHGVGKVERIATEEIAGHTLELIHITFDENRMTLRVPTNKARTAGLRKLASRKQFDDVLATLKGRARIKRTMWSRRAQEYEAKINSGDPQAIAEVVRDLHRNAGQPDQSFSERQIYESALDRLAAEYAALEQVDKPTAVERLIAHLKSE